MNGFGKSTTTRRANRRELLNRMLAKKKMRGTEESIPRRESRQPAPLSSAQARLFFLEQLEGPSSQYHIPVVLRMDGHLSTTALERALYAILDRHQVLRSTFHEGESGSVQIVQKNTFRLDVLDLIGDEGEHAPEENLTRIAQKPFNLATEWPMRIRLLRIAAETHLLAITFHHIAADGWSQSIMIQELVAIYHAEWREGLSNLKPLDIQYADFADWQVTRGEAAYNQSLSYWKQQLAEMPGVIDLPHDLPRPARALQQAGHLPIQLEPNTSRALNDFALKEQATVFMVLLAALQITLCRHARQRDFAIGTPVSGRTHAQLKGLVGCFINTLVLRTPIQLDRTVAEHIAAVRQTVLSAFEHQSVPFENVVEAIEPDRNLNVTPLFQTLLILQNVPSASLQLPALTFTPHEPESEHVQFDLQLSLRETPKGINGRLTFNREIFQQDSMTAFLNRFLGLLGDMIQSPQRKIGHLYPGTQTDSERLAAWNNTEQVYASSNVPSQVKAQTLKTPDRTALTIGANSLSYAALDLAINALVTRLRKLGVTPEDRVGVHMSRSLEIVIALHATMRFGAVYIPLDPELPPNRLETMLEDAAPAAVLDHPDARIPVNIFQGSVYTVPRSLNLEEEATTPAPRIEPSQAAYLIFTSGSTGRPKGVVNHHAGIYNRLKWMQDAFDLGPTDRALQKTPFSFDVSVWEFFWPLMTGSTLVVASPGIHGDPHELSKIIRNHFISTLHFVPSMLKAFLENASAHRSQTLKRVICSGEALSRDLCDQFFEAFPDCELHNLYGPTEAAIDVTNHACRENALGRVPIGRPITNIRTFVMDEAGQSLPAGIPGELYLGGLGLARGYHARASLTASAFVPDPRATVPGDRLYRTGDLVRWLHDGSLDYLGRIDHQVKLRGFRIELGEIESALRDLDHVLDTAVLLAGKGIQAQLTAFVIPLDNNFRDISLLEKALQKRLANYMIPAQWVFLEKFPLTSSGKLNRKALPVPEFIEAGPSVPPETTMEKEIADIWSKTLDRPIHSRDSHFFRNGGHSLLATRVFSRIRERWGVEAPLRLIFRNPVLSQFATAIETLIAEGPRTALPEPTVNPERYRAPLTPAQQRLWFLEQLQGIGSTYSMPFALELLGSLDIEKLAKAFTRVIDRQGTLRSVFAEEEGVPFQRILAVPDIELQPVPITEANLPTYLRASRNKPFDLRNEKPIRIELYRLAVDHHILFVNLHHIVGDGWSLSILVNQVIESYRTTDLSSARQLENSLQFVDVAAWQTDWLRSGKADVQREFWKDYLRNVPPLLPLPTDFPRPAQQNYRGGLVPVVLDTHLHGRLHDIARTYETTLFTVLMAAFQVLLARYTRQDDILVGTPVANRPFPSMEHLIGPLMNMLAIREQVHTSRTFGDHLTKLHENLLDVMSNQDIPFEDLLQQLQPDRNTGSSPLYQVVFVMQNTPSAVIELPDLRVQTLDLPQETAKFDLTLSLTEIDAHLRGYFEYRSDLFSQSTIESLALHFENLLRQIVDAPNEKLSRARLLSEAERLMVLDSLAAPAEPTHIADNLVNRFRSVAKRHANRVAVSTEDGSFTYSELLSRANAIAAALTEFGIKPGDYVGLASEPSRDLIAGLIGILNVGAAYVPLPPHFPAERLRFMATDAGLSLVLGDLGEHAAPLRPLPNLPFESIGDGTFNERTIPAESTTYVIYTSGSTGKPKGVSIRHQNVLALFDGSQELFGFTPDDVSSLFHTYAFDFSVWEIWVPLLFGGCCAVAPYALTREPESFRQWLMTNRVSVLSQTPSAFRTLSAVDQTSEPMPNPPRYIVFGGEELDLSILEHWQARYDDRTQLINMYGITETTVHVTYRNITRADVSRGFRFIGPPLEHLGIYIVDPWLQPVPRGVTGEMLIAGTGLANGYLSRPALTAERFVPNPFSKSPGARLYRSGDLGRLLADGELLYEGRSDHQVKIRGFRIELGEIEFEISREEGIADCRVLPRNETGETYLAAYVILKDDARLQPDRLRESLAARLPDYMLPAGFASLEQYPLTVNGKLDIDALPSLDRAARSSQAFREARTETERILVEICQDVLGMERVSIDDSFFNIGGDSIRSLKLLALAKSRGLSLTLEDIFSAQTLAGLSKKALVATDKSPAVPTSRPFELISDQERDNLPSDVDDAFPMSAIQLGMVLMSLQDQSMAPYHNVSSIENWGTFEPRYLEAALRISMTRHPMLRTAFQLKGFRTPTQIVYRTVETPLYLTDLNGIPETEQQTIIQAAIAYQQRTFFDLSKAPLFRICLFRLDETRFHLIWVEHHAIFDGWSVSLFMREIFDLHQQLVRGEQPYLQPVQTTYRDFVKNEQAALAKDESRQFFQDLLADFTVNKIPRNSRNPLEGQRIRRVDLSEDQTVGLQTLAAESKVRLNHLFLTICARVIGLISNSRDVLTGIITHGRLATEDGDQVIGTFLNTQPFRLNLAPCTWRQLAQSAASLQEALQAHRFFPFSETRRLVRADHMYDTLFNFTDFGVGQGEDPGGAADNEENQILSRTETPLTFNVGRHPSGAYFFFNLICEDPFVEDAFLDRLGFICLNTVTAVLSDPDGLWQSKDLLPDGDRRKLLQTWQGEDFPLPPEPMTETILQRATAYPERIAVTQGSRFLTYGELARSVARAEHDCLSKGVRSGDVLAFTARQDLETIVMFLASLRQGLIALPISDDWPEVRKQAVIEEANPRLCVSAQPHWEQQTTPPSPAPISTDSGAFLVFTSGSTGKPKGVLNVHRGLWNTMHWYDRVRPFTGTDRMLHIASMTFDQALMDIFYPLLGGGCIVLAEDPIRRDPRAIAAMMTSHYPTCLDTVPSMARAIIDHYRNPCRNALTKLFLGGEALQPELATRLRHMFPGIVISNHYGPSEAAFEVVNNVYTEDGPSDFPIGKPFQNLQIYLTDRTGNLAPIGTQGELLVGGHNLGSGYLHRPALTAEKWVPNPFGSTGGRLYRTGDLAYWREDGQLEYVSRIDHQIKLRGQRIELGEIETVLRGMDHVQDAVVMVTGSQNSRLSAWVETNRSQSPEAVRDMRSQLSHHLPDYMIPNEIQFLAELPLTATGKLNRKALEAMAGKASDEGTFDPPCTSLEMALAEIWCDILQVEQVGRDSNFFELGGHSLTLANVAAAISDRWDRNVPFQVLFNYPILCHLAEALEQIEGFTQGDEDEYTEEGLI